jgi:AraC-like DNA-binding protein
MATPHPTATPTSCWIAPRVALASCVRAYLTRSTLACAALPTQALVNRFPAHAYCSITWFTADVPRLLAPSTDPGMGRQVPQVMFGGPRSEPVATGHAGPMHGFLVAFYPEALHALTGIDVQAHIDRFVPLAEALGEPWQALSQQVLAAPDDATRITLIDQFLEPRWQAAREQGLARRDVVGDWVRALSGHAAAMCTGQSARNIERRIKAWAGQPLRRLRRLTRAEQSLIALRERQQSGPLSWADIADQGGYADQSHLCRELRELTGHSPSELADKVAHDDSYWAYRLWRR